MSPTPSSWPIVWLRIGSPSETLRRPNLRFSARPTFGGSNLVINFIHALFHLERPTVTIVVRNESCDLPYPQYTYLRPGLGWHSLWEDRAWSKRLESVHALVVLDPQTGRQTIKELVAGGATTWEAFLLLVYWSRIHGWDEIALDLADRLVRRAGALQ